VFIIIGLVVVLGSVLFGYTMHHGKIGVLIQVSEFIIIGGAGLGAMIIGNPPNTIARIIKAVLALLKPSPFGRPAYGELLQVLYDVFQTARKDGLIALETHIEEPEKSALFGKHHGFLHHKHAVAFLCDTLKVLLTGAVEDHHLSEILDMDLERQHEEEMEVPNAIAKVADAMPGFGIVAAVLGVVITMGSIGGEASAVGEKVAAALVGTFLGILLSYGVLGPLATAVEARVRGEASYMSCIRTALLGFARGDSPMTCVEFARRNIEPGVRPSFAELEALTRRKAA
jgi:chemotaxis protein MotA